MLKEKTAAGNNKDKNKKWTSRDIQKNCVFLGEKQVFRLNPEPQQIWFMQMPMLRSITQYALQHATYFQVELLAHCHLEKKV